MLLVLLPAGAPVARAAQQGFPVVPAGTTAGQTRLVVECPGSSGPSPSFSVTVDGAPRPTTSIPLLSDRLTLAVVVDASQSAGSVLQSGISGVVDLVLGAPAGLRATLVADTGPPVVVSPLGARPAELLDGLSTIRPGGERQTVAALDLAARQLPPEAESPRLVVLHTAAPDAPGRSAPDLGARLAADGIVLAVVTTATDGGPVPPYWSTAAATTGGAAISVRGPEAVDGFTRLATALRNRYVLTVPAPDRFPADVAVRLDSPAGTLTSGTVVAAPAPAPAPPAPAATPTPSAAADGGSGPGAGVGVAGGLALLVLVLLAMRLTAARRARPAAPDRDGGSGAGARPTPEEPAIGTARDVSGREFSGRDFSGRDVSGRDFSAWDVPARPEPVADRESLLTAMHGAVRAGTPLVLYGDGPTGVGATTAMIEFAHRNRQDYDVVWWVAAEDPPSVRDRLAELAETLGLAGPDDTAAVATERLFDGLRGAGGWLLLLDDAPGPDELADLLSAGSGHVVLCSTDPQWREHGPAVAVPPMRRAESVALLRTRHPALSAADADRLAAALDDVPLALVPAGATLADTGIDVADYLDALSTDRADGDGSDRTAPSAAWAVALDRLAADDPRASALLTSLAWLAPQPVPLDLFTRHPDLLPLPLAGAAREPHDLAERAATLQRRGLARVGSDSVALHPTAGSWIRARTAAERPGDLGWAASTVGLLRAALAPSMANPLDPAARSTWRRLLPHVLAATDPERDLDDVDDDVSRLLQQAGRYLRARGEARFARALLTDAHDLFRQRLGDDHPDTVASARELDHLRTLGGLNGTAAAHTAARH